MATLGLLLSQPKQVTIAYVDDINDDYKIEFLVSEEHDWSSDVTEYAIEAGASDATDNRRKRPRRFAISGMVNDTPINIFEVVQNLVNESRVDSAIQFFKRLYDSSEFVQVTFKHQIYQNCLVESIKWGRSADRGDKIVYTIAFKEVSVVKASLVPLKDSAKAADGSPKKEGVGSATQDAGKKPPKVDEKGAPSDLSRLIGVGA